METQHASYGDQRKFGRLVSIDFRDKDNLLRIPRSLPKRGIRYYFTPKPLDQGNTSQCVAYSGEHFLLSGAVINKMYKTPGILYDECQGEDEWEGKNYDGTSVRALMKVFQNAGLLESYKWGFTLDPVIFQLLNFGPVIMGTNWYSSMMDTDAKHFIRIRQGSYVTGGHAWLVKGINLEKGCPDGSTGAVRMMNSWGTDWGQRGFAWVSLKDLERLILENGEAATAREIKFKSTQNLEESVII